MEILKLLHLCSYWSVESQLSTLRSKKGISLGGKNSCYQYMSMRLRRLKYTDITYIPPLPILESSHRLVQNRRAHRLPRLCVSWVYQFKPPRDLFYLKL